SRRAYLLAGAAVGLATGTKYNAAVCALALVVAHVLYWKRASLGRSFLWLAASGALALLVFLATTPYALLDWPHFVEGLRANTTHYADGTNGNFRGPWNVGGYARFIWNSGLYQPTCAIAVLGLPLLLRRFPRQSALLLVVSLGELLLLLPYSVNFVRNVLPVYPLLILIAAAGA